MNDFLAAGVPRWLAIWDGAQSRVELISANKCQGYAQGSRARSSSPRKRSKPYTSPDDISKVSCGRMVTPASCSSCSQSDSSGEDSDWDDNRGRKRRRTDCGWSPSTDAATSFSSSSTTLPEEDVVDRDKLCESGDLNEFPLKASKQPKIAEP